MFATGPLEIVLRCDAFSLNASPAPPRRSAAVRSLGGIASHGRFAATALVHLRDQHFGPDRSRVSRHAQPYGAQMPLLMRGQQNCVECSIK
jgi:hypothetical protein